MGELEESKECVGGAGGGGAGTGTGTVLLGCHEGANGERSDKAPVIFCIGGGGRLKSTGTMSPVGGVWNISVSLLAQLSDTDTVVLVSLNGAPNKVPLLSLLCTCSAGMPLQITPKFMEWFTLSKPLSTSFTSCESVALPMLLCSLFGVPMGINDWVLLFEELVGVHTRGVLYGDAIGGVPMGAGELSLPWYCLVTSGSAFTIDSYLAGMLLLAKVLSSASIIVVGSLMT